MKPRQAFLSALLAVIPMTSVTSPLALAAPAGATTQRISPTAVNIACRYEYTMTAWQGGFSGSLKVKNTGTDPAKAWWIEFDVPPGALITNVWDGTISSRRDRIRINAPERVKDLYPGQYTEQGFVGEYSGDHVTITNVALNGVACTIT